VALPAQEHAHVELGRQTWPVDPSVGDRLKASIVGFEASHPRLATLLNDVVEKLGNIGI